MGKIQMTKDQAMEVMVSCLAVSAENYLGIACQTVENMKSNGYIKQSALEIAKDKFKILMIKNENHITETESIMIDYTVELELDREKLKKEIDRLKQNQIEEK